jgi:kumamolisin
MFHRIIFALSLLLAFSASSASAAAPAGHTALTFYDSSSTHQLATAYSPDQIATAYDFAPLTSQGIDGSNQSVALIEIDGFDPADVRQFDAMYNLPDPAIQQYYPGGKSFRTEKHGETTMDIEWLHALAPHATIQIYYLKNYQSAPAGWQSMATVVRTAAQQGARAVSISLGACGPGKGSKATRTAFAGLMHLGVSIFVSSGDSGAYPGPVKECGRKYGVAYPAGDPSVVSVGGTSLKLNGDNSIASEVAWHRSGGGQTSLLRPAWQVAAGIPLDKYRWAPDVAFLGDPNTGVNVYWKGKWQQAGGTSLGAPCWAAAWALIRQDQQVLGGGISTAPALLYRIANSASFHTAFHDIRTGSNGRYRAKPGWNPVTGWGTPDVGSLATAVSTLFPGQ